VAAALLPGCGGSQPPIGAASAMPQSRAIAVHHERDGSWMLPEAKHNALLYISNVYTVTVYTYPKGRHVGTLKGFYRPLGECVDMIGDVFIANGDTVLEFPHGGNQPIQTLSFNGYGAQNCTTDPTTGNLAVTWAQGFKKGYVAVYQHASGTPTLYSNGGMLFTFCGYDDRGNLYVDGLDKRNQYAFEFAELSAGTNKIKTVNLNQGFQNGAAVQWDGKYVTIVDNTANNLYRFSIAGNNGTLKGTVALGNAQGLYQTWIDGKKVVGADDIASAAWYWDYPEGGAPIKSVTKDVDHPFGATISKATQ